MTKEWFANADWSLQAQEEFHRRLGRARGKRVHALRVKASYLWRSGDADLARAALVLLQTVVDEHVDDALITTALREKALCHESLGEFREAAACYKLCLDYEERDDSFNTVAWKDYSIFLAKHESNLQELGVLIDAYCPSQLDKPFVQTAMQAIHAKANGQLNAINTATNALKMVGADDISCNDLSRLSYYESIIDVLKDIEG